MIMCFKVCSVALWIFLFFFASFAVKDVEAQTVPNGYTPNFRFRMWSQGANPSADSLNANWKDVDHQIYERGWTLGNSKVYPTVAGWKAHFRTGTGDTTGSALVNIYGNTDIGSTSVNAIVTQSYNGIVAPNPGVVANIVTGIKLINNTAATSLAHNNSPALQLKQFSWNPTAGASQENSWYLHNWGFATSGTAGGVFTITNKRPSDPNTYSTFAIDEIGRTIIGYTKSHGSNYYGFWGEDLGQWGVILAHTLPVIVGWPENSVTTDFYVTGNTKLTGNFGVGTTAAAKAHILSTTEQLRLGYDASNYFKITVGSTGIATLAGVGSGASISTALPFNISGLITTTNQAIVVNAGASSNATIDLKGGSGFNVGMVTYYAGSGGWLIGNHSSSDFNIYSYAANQDRFRIRESDGVITVGNWKGSAIDTAYLNAVSNIVAIAPLSVTTSGKTRFLSFSDGAFGSMAYADSAKYHGSASINTLGTITSGTWNAGAITTNSSIVINPGGSGASTVDAKTNSTADNLGLVTYHSGIAQWLVGNHANANFALYSYGTGTDVFVVNRANGAITTGVWNATVITDTYLATISTAGKVSGSAVTSGTIAGTTIWSTSGNITSTGATSLSYSTAGTPTLNLTNDANSATERALRIFSQGSERAYWASNGAIYINNAVNVVSPTSPNRTITIVVGGTTYYIHAKTTND